MASVESARARSWLRAVLGALVFAGFALGEGFVGWYLQNEQGFEGSHDGTRQTVLAAGFAAAAVLCLLRGAIKSGARPTGLELAVGLAAQVGLSALAVYLVDQSQKGAETLVSAAALALLGALWAACGLRWRG